MTGPDEPMPEPAVAVEPDDDEPILWTQNLTRRFNGTTAVSELNLAVETGSITGVVGPNGAGKTTTFLMLATLLMPSSGDAFVCGFDPVTESRDVRRSIGYMPDFFGIYDDLRVDEYLDFFAASYGAGPSTRKRLIDDLLELVDLTTKREALVNSLSRGMKQRLGLARSLVHDPKLLILDEPASGLDPRARVELRALLHELQSMGKTILISSHILSELQEICSHVAIMEAGKLIAQGSPAEIVSGLALARRVRIRTAPGGLPALQAAVAEYPGVAAVAEEDDVVELELAGGDDEAAAFLRHLVGGGIPVIDFTQVETGLEEIFMRVTKGVVS